MWHYCKEKKSLRPWDLVKELTNTHTCTHTHTSSSINLASQTHRPYTHTHARPQAMRIVLHEHTQYISRGKTETQRPDKTSQRDPTPAGSKRGMEEKEGRGSTG